ncbi:bifunctional heptose 7-phosphate kinase/heptose 1-phosphate adenyltransferase [Helicobacter didelphidarum]|uniref:Bifunctional protein HldE n=1 Tax=Helicobacter didelphidarum TaxID=2040648 RepID=A0A3D8IGM6_9HELI|nr:D-glycero-beta-D-manno-heptose-7-phosphate kinase [Helicobacter didelphidarum]RDU64076.1 bifunctional heptose 7-phosphate kinase/heptose 1-phosphate adenyltransferase [Helicobacter didelphidarum]
MVAQNRTIHAIIIGDLILDKYIWGNAHKLSPEAPVPVVRVEKESFNLGGACNVANNLIAMNAKATIYGVVGNDMEGSLLHDFLLNKGIESHCYKSNRPTTTKTRIMSSKHQMLRIDKESTGNLEHEIYEEMFDSIQSNITKYHCMILSDYLKGVLSGGFTQKLIKLALSFDIPVLCDPKGNDYSKYKNATLLTPNKKEAMEATHITIHNDKTLHDALNKLQKTYHVRYPLITLSEDGIGYLDNGIFHKKPTIAKEVYDVSGAGDTVIAALALQLAQRKTLDDATAFANAAAAVVIGKIGSATATLDEIEEVLKSHPLVHDIESKIIVDIDDIDKIIKNKKVVFTNGCFDILHYGHVKYLEEARKLGDILIVGLNSDSSVQRLKGDFRPINPQQDRAFILAGLTCVDYIILFEDDTPENLIAQIRPNVLVKGGDYADKKVIGSEYAQSVKLIDFIDDKSTTNIIKKIQQQNAQ